MASILVTISITTVSIVMYCGGGWRKPEFPTNCYNKTTMQWIMDVDSIYRDQATIFIYPSVKQVKLGKI